MLLKLAWRNIWRNKRRTFITIGSIMFAVLAATTMKSIQWGAWGHMVDNVVNFYFGYAQIHQKGYWDEQTIDKSMVYSEASEATGEHPNVLNIVPRLESFALASFETNTTGALVVGIDPVLENQMTKLESRLVKGDYFKAADESILLGEDLASKLKISIGDTIVLVSQGYHGVNAAGKYAVAGLLRFGSPELNNQMAYIPLAAAQKFYGAEGLVTSLVLDIDDRDQVKNIVSELKSRMDLEAYEVLDWQELIPDLVEAKAVDEAGGNVVLAVLYLIIGFGIFGTILMMTKEREYEFGVLISIGMQRFKLSTAVWIETIILGFLGVLAGVLISLPIVGYLYKNPIRMSGDFAAVYEKFGVEPIIPAAFDYRLFLFQAAVVFVITTFLAIYPFRKIYKLDPVKAMRN